MTDSSTNTLLEPGDVAPFETVNENTSSPFFLTCEHAGRTIPTALGNLNIPAVEMERHIAYDIGAEPLAKLLSQKLSATLVLQPYSRLVIDCNRSLESPDCMPEASDGTHLPANIHLSHAEQQQRINEIHQPFHAEITRQLNARENAGIPTLLISVHSFTPRLATSDQQRPWHLGILYHRDDRLAHRMMAAFDSLNSDFLAAFNEPYEVDDLSDYTLPVHGEARGIPHVLLEIRNDEIATPAGQAVWAELLSAVINKMLSNEREWS